MAATIEQKPANRLPKDSWLASSRNESSTRDILEQTTVFNNAVIIKNANILILKDLCSFLPRVIWDVFVIKTNKFYKCTEIAKRNDLQNFKFNFETYKREM